MATLSVRLRNEANTSTVATLTNAFDISFQVERNDVGSGSFRLDKRDPQRSLVAKGSVVQILLDGAPKFLGRIGDENIVEVSESDEGVEATEFDVVDILADWDFAVVRLSTVPQCDLVPTLDERIWNWASGEYNPYQLFESWPKASAIANQGWGSTFYTGLPSGWTDGDAWFVWASTGTAENADPGYCYFKDIFLVGAGRKVLDWAADNIGTLYVNGKKVQDGSDFRKKQTYEFETTAGFLTLAWEVLNVADDGPPGGNPGGLIFSMRDGSPEGDVLRRSGASGIGANTATHLRMLEYPTAPPGHSIGAVIRLAAEQNAIIWDTWTLDFTDLLDTDGAAFPIVDELTFRLYEDSMLDVLKAAAQSWIDFRVDPGDGKVLKAYVKGTIANSVSIPLVTGYSSAGQAAPGTVNVFDLEWKITPPEYTALAVRYADGWIEVGEGDRWGTLRLEQYNDPDVAEAIGSQLLDLYDVDQETASFSFLPLDEPTDQPLFAFSTHDTWNIPGPLDHDSSTVQVITSIAVSQTDEGEVRYDIEVGPPILDEIEWLERAIRRSGPGTMGGRANQASVASGKQPFHNSAKPRSYAPGAGQSAHCIASAPSASERTSVAPNLFVGMVTSLRLIGQGGTGTSTVSVSDGADTWVLSGTGEGLVDFEPGINVTWTTGTIVTVDITAVGHEDLHVFADVADVN